MRRYKRFFADVVLDDGREVVAHIANPGAMLGLTSPGLPVWLSPSTSETRKLAWTWEMAEENGGLVGVNTIKPPFTGSSTKLSKGRTASASAQSRPAG